MIAIARTSSPEVLVKYGKEWLNALQQAIHALDTLEKDTSATPAQLALARKRKKQAEEKYNHHEIKTALIQMFHNKCAYCESKIRIVAYGDIEHFCPKSHSFCINRIFDWDNLLLSCSICNNRTHKGDQFQVDSNGNILLVNPTDPTTIPTNHLRFYWDEIAGIASIYGLNERGISTVETFDLNGVRGRKELIRERSSHIKMLLALLKLAKQGDDRAHSLLNEACQPDAPYLAFTLKYIAPVLTTLDD